VPAFATITFAFDTLPDALLHCDALPPARCCLPRLHPPGPHCNNAAHTLRTPYLIRPSGLRLYNRTSCSGCRRRCVVPRVTDDLPTTLTWCRDTRCLTPLRRHYTYPDCLRVTQYVTTGGHRSTCRLLPTIPCDLGGSSLPADAFWPLRLRTGDACPQLPTTFNCVIAFRTPTAAHSVPLCGRCLTGRRGMTASRVTTTVHRFVHLPILTVVV